MSIEIGKKYINKYGEVVEVTNFYESVSIWCIWFIDSENNSHILTERDFLEQYKPYEVVYEYRWATEERYGLTILDRYLTEEEIGNTYGDRKQRLDFTKRERK